MNDWPKYYLNTLPRDGFSYWKFTGENKKDGEFFYYSKSNGNYKIGSDWSHAYIKAFYKNISENSLTLLLLEQ